MNGRLLAVLATAALISSPHSQSVPASTIAYQEATGAQVWLGFLGDGGTGKDEQKEVASRLEAARAEGKLDYVFLLGDNIYNNGEARHIRSKYLNVYRELLAPESALQKNQA